MSGNSEDLGARLCERCRRIRVTSRGALVACRHNNRHFDLTDCWDGRRLDEERANEILKKAIMEKPAEGWRSQSLTMVALGG